MSSDKFEDFDQQFEWSDLFGDADEKEEDRELDAKEIIYIWEKVFTSIGTPEYKGILEEASDLFIELPSEDYIDAREMVCAYAKAIAYRNKLIKIKIKLRRIYAAKSRSFTSMQRSIIGKAKGTALDKQAKAGDQLGRYEKQVGDTKDALDTVIDIIENLDSTAMQLSRILKLMEMRPNSYYVSAGETAMSSNEDEVVDEWGSAATLNRQLGSRAKR